MGKNLIQQRRGKGNPRYRSPSHRFPGLATYDKIPKGATLGIVTKIIDAPGKTLPLAEVDYNGERVLHLPNQGIAVGQTISMSSVQEGNIVTVKDIPEGTKIYNIELRPGDGGRLCRSSGTFAVVVAREEKKVVVLMPSKKKKEIPADCRATVGMTAGAGRKDKPFMKAGTRFHAMKALGKFAGKTSATHKNAVQHPFGGKNLGKHKTVGRNRPPGRKVGSLAPRRTGKK
ncbi:MAG: 50S ribosomal protein L2 [Candidatus Aenigmarchaeota archaeon]|nr:50S ribosomal protein L2 [Candidatus Aenigmarchaeota archaeon]